MDALPTETRAIGKGTTALLLSLFAGSIVMAYLSNGAHHDDDLVHFFMGRWSWVHWEYLLHPWGRPGLTLPLALVSWIGSVDTGWFCARILSACVTATGAWLAADLALRLGGRRPWLVVLACYLQPLNAVLSYTTLTENFAAFYVVAAVSLLARRRVVTASVVFSLAMVTRYELVVLFPIWFLAIWFANSSRRRRSLAVGASFAAMLCYNLVFYLLLADWPARLYFAGTGSTRYTAAGLLSYVPHLSYAVTPSLVGLAVIGGVGMARRGRFLVPAIAGAYLAVHLCLRAFGLFASGGFGRFMVTVSPFIAILCAEGVAELMRAKAASFRIRWPWVTIAGVFVVVMLGNVVEASEGRIALPAGWLRHLTLWLPLLPIGACFLVVVNAGRERAGTSARAAVVVLGTLCVIQWLVTVRPLTLSGWPKRTGEVVAWLKDRGYEDRPTFAATPWVVYWMGQVEKPRLDKGPALLASMPVGTILVWDSLYCPSDFHRLPLRDVEANGAYTLLERFELANGSGGNAIIVFEKTIATPAPAHEKSPYPPNLMIRRDRAHGVYYTREKAAPLPTHSVR